MNNKSIKLTVWTTLFAISTGLIACQKEATETPAQEDEVDVVTMSAEPAEGNAPAIVADDLDDVDAQLGKTALLNEENTMDDMEAAQDSTQSKSINSPNIDTTEEYNSEESD